MAKHLSSPSKEKDNQAARPGSLNAEILADLQVYREFMDDRDRALVSLYGKRLLRSQLRDDLVRAVLIQFGNDQIRNISFYQKTLSHLGSQSVIRTEVLNLVGFGLFLFRDAPADRRSALVVPTQRLVDWYSTHMPALYDELRRFMTVREAMRDKNAFTDTRPLSQ